MRPLGVGPHQQSVIENVACLQYLMKLSVHLSEHGAAGTQKSDWKALVAHGWLNSLATKRRIPQSAHSWLRTHVLGPVKALNQAEEAAREAASAVRNCLPELQRMVKDLGQPQRDGCALSSLISLSASREQTSLCQMACTFGGKLWLCTFSCCIHCNNAGALDLKSPVQNSGPPHLHAVPPCRFQTTAPSLPQ